MTVSESTTQSLPSSNNFLNTVCPGFQHLDFNVHYNLQGKNIENDRVDLPFSLNQKPRTGVLDTSYLNIARRILNSDSNESTTYVSLPYHVTELFKKIVKNSTKQIEGSMHIGANVNPLSQDRFKLVHLNPGCLTEIIEIDNLSRGKSNGESIHKGPFDKLTSNFGKILKINSLSSNTHKTDNCSNLLNFIDNKTPNSHSLIDKVLQLDQDTYLEELQSVATKRLLISTNVNVLNVIALDESSNYRFPQTVTTELPIIPYEVPSENENEKLVESTLLRLQFNSLAVITCLKSFINSSNEPIIIIGFESSEIMLINLAQLGYQVFEDLAINSNFSESSPIVSPNFGHVPVTSMEVIQNPYYDFLIVAGYANGEIVILNTLPSHEKKKNKYLKAIVGKDEFVTYFKKFDLSSFAKYEDTATSETPNFLVGHFKVSHKPITSICSTISYDSLTTSSYTNPMIIAVASDDGFVRLIDLVYTHDQKYGDPSDPLNNSLVTDMISNYFNDGITNIEFSKDFKFLCVVGKGDLIEIFKMTYYNVNGLLHKNSRSTHQSSSNISGMNKGRSRSGTLNSMGSNNYNFSSSSAMTPNHSFDIRDEGNSKGLHPSVIKDIRIVTRLKGHSNTVNKIKFISDIHSSELQSSNNLLYKLISCGFDGKILFWDFDYKALPKIKKLVIPNKKQVSHSKKTANNRKSGTVPILTGIHTRSRSINATEDFPSFSVGSFGNMNPSLNNTGSMNITSILNSVTSNGGNNTSNASNIEYSESEKIKIINSLYKSLHELRLKRFYTTSNKKFSAVIHPILNDKVVPSIEIPASSIDMSCQIRDGKIDGFYLDPFYLWCFSKGGDIFRYAIS